MYLVLLFAVLGHAAAIVAIALVAARVSRLGRRIAGGIALGLGVATVAVGYVGWQHGLHMTDEALAGVDPQMHEALRAQGEKEAGHNLTFGLYACALPILVGGGVLALSRET